MTVLQQRDALTDNCLALSVCKPPFNMPAVMKTVVDGLWLAQFFFICLKIRTVEVSAEPPPFG